MNNQIKVGSIITCRAIYDIALLHNFEYKGKECQVVRIWTPTQADLPTWEWGEKLGKTCCDVEYEIVRGEIISVKSEGQGRLVEHSTGRKEFTMSTVLLSQYELHISEVRENRINDLLNE